MSSNNQCKVEFYFKREKIERLLRENPDARGIIISQEIKVRFTADKKKLNVMEICARADNRNITSRALKSTVSATEDGCPFPPGCDNDDDIEE